MATRADFSDIGISLRQQTSAYDYGGDDDFISCARAGGGSSNSG